MYHLGFVLSGSSFRAANWISFFGGDKARILFRLRFYLLARINLLPTFFLTLTTGLFRKIINFSP